MRPTRDQMNRLFVTAVQIACFCVLIALALQTIGLIKITPQDPRIP
jgi:hypothetical protein